MEIDPLRYLQEAGRLHGGDVDIGASALCLAAVGPAQYSGRILGRYFHHLKIMAEEVGARYTELLNAGGADDPQTRLAALKHIISDKYGYEGGAAPRDLLRESDLIAVTDTRKGNGWTLGILYLQAGLAQGWDICALNMPFYCLLRIEAGGQRIIFDPLEQGRLLDAAGIRAILKGTLGGTAELSAAYFEPLDRRDLLVRLQNIIKSRQIEEADYWGALETVETARLVAPDEYRLLLDAGVLYAKTGQPEKAEQALEDYIKMVKNPKDRYDAELLLAQIRTISEG